MLCRRLGNTGVELSILTYGAMGIDVDPARGTSPSLLRALECGINSVDTARAYGHSEEVIRKTLQEYSGPKPFLSTKVLAKKTGNARDYVPLEQAYTPESIRSSFEESLSLLGVECVDLLWLHQWYYLWGKRPEWLETFRQLRQEGKIRYIGISTQDHEHDAALQMVDERLVDAVMLVFNIFETRPLNAMLPLAEERGVAVYGRGALDAGGLSGAFDADKIQQSFWLQAADPRVYLDKVSAIQKEFCPNGESLAELAIRFALTPKSVTTIALSMNEPQWVESSVKAAEAGPLSDDVFEALRTGHSWVKNFYADGRLGAPDMKRRQALRQVSK